jgi:hypothetical protein
VPCRSAFGKQDGVNKEAMNKSGTSLFAVG